MKCNHLDDIIRAEIPIVQRHLQEHKWYHHIQDDTQAQIDFIEKYGWLMREYYCDYICPDKETCQIKEYQHK